MADSFALISTSTPTELISFFAKSGNFEAILCDATLNLNKIKNIPPIFHDFESLINTFKSKKTPEEKENSFVNRILRGDFDNSSIIEKDEIKEIKTEIEKLKAQNNNQIDNEKIIKQIKMLSDLKDEGILTESEFIDKKRILLDKLK